ncbi:hypothetical protein CEXT_446671 [Caerostris extrusa]|uniref:Uncharacterized protein n=1 Tax=Caerostris extrusa TaxID=172846 RepID=A0AAV4NKT4_CAEEX|nr:hypothetical protein CEXT_446671 [Caerostris extrusa]
MSLRKSLFYWLRSNIVHGCCLAVDMVTIKSIGSILIIGDIYECHDSNGCIRNFDLVGTWGVENEEGGISSFTPFEGEEFVPTPIRRGPRADT